MFKQWDSQCLRFSKILRLSKIRIFKKIKISKKLTISHFIFSGFFCKLASSVQIDEKSDMSEKHTVGTKNHSSLANDFIMRSCGLLKKWKIAGVDYSAF